MTLVVAITAKLTTHQARGREGGDELVVQDEARHRDRADEALEHGRQSPLIPEELALGDQSRNRSPVRVGARDDLERLVRDRLICMLA